MSKNKDVIKRLKELDYIIELYQILGEYNLLAKLIVPNIESAETFINKLGTFDGILDVKNPGNSHGA